MKNKLMAVVAFGFGLAGCQHAMMMAPPTKPVIPMVNNTFETYGLGETSEASVKEASHNAKATCYNDYNKSRYVVTNIDTKYKGLLDEQTGDIVNRVGSIVSAVSGEKVPSIKTKLDYKTTVVFKCSK